MIGDNQSFQRKAEFYAYAEGEEDDFLENLANSFEIEVSSMTESGLFSIQNNTPPASQYHSPTNFLFPGKTRKLLTLNDLVSDFEEDQKMKKKNKKKKKSSKGFFVDVTKLFGEEFHHTQKLIADRFIKGRTLGQGMYGTVFSAIDTYTNQIVAVKKVCKRDDEDDELNISDFRELICLGLLSDCRFVLSCLDTFFEEKSFMVVLEKADSNLHELIDQYPEGMPSPACKRNLFMLLIGLAFCRLHNIVHRDLKPDNILISGDILKIADFGLSCPFYSETRLNSPEAVTLLYRAPEAFFGNTKYGFGLDMWSTGCIFAEFLKGSPLFKGLGEISLFTSIVNLLGTPSEDIQFSHIFIMNKKIPLCKDNLRKEIPRADDLALDLLLKMLHWDPYQRITPLEALDHPYFNNLRDELEREFKEDLALVSFDFSHPKVEHET